MSELSDAAGSAVPFPANGKTYLLSPLDIGDLGDFEMWADALPLDMVLGMLDRVPEAHRQHLLDRAYDECHLGERSLTMPDGQRLLNSVRGVAFLWKKSLRKRQPDMTDAECHALLNMANMERARDLISKLSGLAPLANAADDNEADDGADESDPTTRPAVSNGANSTGISSKSTAGGQGK